MSLEVQATTRKATLTLLLKEGESSAALLASALEISVQAMRRHLRSLEEDGLVAPSLISHGPGRPLNLWKLTPKGQKSFSDGTEEFALELFESIQDNLSPEMLNSLLTKQTLAKGLVYRNKIGLGVIKERLERFVDLRNSEGYMAEFHSGKDDVTWFLNTFHCAITAVAEKFPVVCDQELQLIRFTFPDCNVQRVQWRFEYGHSCGFEITPSQSNG